MLAFLLLLSYMNFFVAILMLIAFEILLNLRYPLAGFKRYYCVNALGVLIYTSIFILWHRNMPSFQQHWLLAYNGILLVVLAPLLGYGLKVLLDKKQTIYLAHILMPGIIMLTINILMNGSVTGVVILMVLLVVIIWQIFGSVGLSPNNFWKFYLANVIGLILFLPAAGDKDIFFMSLPSIIEQYKPFIGYILGIPLVGLFIGLIRNNVNFKPIDDNQKVNQLEQRKPTENE
jgi:hypothetical protein